MPTIIKVLLINCIFHTDLFGQNLKLYATLKCWRRHGMYFAANTYNSLGMPYCKYPPVWRWFGKYDFDSLDQQYDDVLNVNPDAQFIYMIDLNSPVWLQKQLALRGQSAECDSFMMLSCACSNPDWRKATGDYLEAVVKYMEERYGDRIKAYLLADGTTDEWMDYSKNAAGRFKTQAWMQWLSDKGKNTVPVPSFDRIDNASFDDFIRDPQTEQDIIDYAQFSSDIIVNTVLEFADLARQLIPRNAKLACFSVIFLNFIFTGWFNLGILNMNVFIHQIK